MKAITENSKTIVFFEDQLIKGRLVYSKGLSGKAIVSNEENQEFELVPVNFWKTKFELRSGEKVIINLVKKWTGKTLLQTVFSAGKAEYTFRHKGLFHGRYVLTDKDDRELAVVRSKFIWKGLRHDFDIEISDSLKRRQQYFLLLAIMVFLARLLMKQRSRSVTAGI